LELGWGGEKRTTQRAQKGNQPNIKKNDATEGSKKM